MLLSSLACVAGLALLIGGAELLVRGASDIALRARVSPGTVGLTVVAAGTSMPELVVSVGAAIHGSSDIAISNVVGSNIYNILLILGVAALIRPLQITWSTARSEWLVMAASTWLLILLIRDGSLDWMEGVTLVLGLVLFTAHAVIRSRGVPRTEQEEVSRAALAHRSAWLAILGVLGGTGLLVAGGELLVRGATTMAIEAGVSERVVGLTIVAVGTSLPELVTSAVAAWRGNSDIALANVVGSNIFNILGILGTTACIRTIGVSQATLDLDRWVLFASALVLLPLMRSGYRLSRLEGALLAAGSVVWTVVLIR